MKILLIHQYFLEKNDGGGSRFNEMTRIWEEDGHEITVLAGMVHYATGRKPEKYKGKYFYTEVFYDRVKVIRCHVSEAYNASFLGRMWAYFSFVFSSAFAGLFKARGKYDVIIVTSPPLFVGATAVLLYWLRRIPYVFEVRDLWPESAIDTGVLKNRFLIKFAYWVEAFVYKRAKRINVLTPAFRQKLIKAKAVPPEKIIFIPNAADFSLSDELLKTFDAGAFRKNLGLEGKKVFTYVGAHGVANHLIQILEAAQLLKHREDIVFQLIGAGMQKEMLKKEAQKRNLSNVIFVDPVPKREVFKYILASDVGMSVLKKVDTFKTIYSNKTFDYMACKKPVLLVIDGVSRELVETAGCGIFAEPENPQAIADVTRRFADLSPDERKQMGEAGYAYAKQHFDRARLAKRYLEEIQPAL